MSQVLVIVLSLLILVGSNEVLAFGSVTNSDVTNQGHKVVSSKVVQAICEPTDYKDACMKSLATVRTHDPKELVRAAFSSAKSELIAIANHSPVLKAFEDDPKTAEAVKDCKELFQDAIHDFQRSFDEVGRFELHKDHANDMLSNLKIWISATRTYQETCLDGFENTTSDASAKVRKVLQTAIKMSSNGLAIVDNLSSLLSSFSTDYSFNKGILSHALFNRRLLNINDNVGSRIIPEDEDDGKRRRLLSEASVVGHSYDEDIWPEWVDGFRHKLLESPDLASDLKDKANVVVAKDGSGKYKTVEEALNDVPKEGKESFIIYIKEGVYIEYLVVHKWMTNVVLIGDGPTKTRITNNKNFIDGVKTFKTATIAVLGDFFVAKDIGIENSAGAIKHQAVALRAQSDKSIYFNCHFDGYQDTLYTHTYRQFYRDCKISGTIDFIFGDATVFFQKCTFVVRKPLDNQNCIVTAQGRMERHQPTGIIIHKCKFEADIDYLPVKDKNKAYLGRPWKEYSKTIIMESQIDDFIQPDGWLPWEGDFGLDTCYYGEYNNVGGGSSLAKRVKWRGVKTIIPSRAQTFMPPKLYENDVWIKTSGIPYEPNLSSAPGPSSGIDEDPNAPTATSISPSTTMEGTSTPTSTPIDTSQDQSSSTTSSAPSPAVKVGPVTIRELERILMQNKEMEGDEGAVDDMSGNVPDGDEPSPARVEPPSPAPSPSSGDIVVSPSSSEEGSTNQPSPTIAPAIGPAPEDEADKVAPTPAKTSSGTKSHSELHVILSGIVMLIVLFV